jgi:hypothetical protein
VSSALVPAGPESLDMQGLFSLALNTAEDKAAALERLIELHNRQQDRSAEKEFTAALVRFRGEMGAIETNRTGKIGSRGGTEFTWRYADFHQIMEQIQAGLDREGFSLAFDTVTDGKMMTVTGRLHHVAGHSRDSSFGCPVDSANPGMAPQHRFGGAETFAKRHVVVNLLGLAYAEPEAPTESREPVSEEQAANIEALITETGADLYKFLRFIGAETISDIREADYERAVLALEKKRGK